MVSAQSIERHSDSGFRISIIVSVLALGALLTVFVPVFLVVCVFLGGASIWMVFTRPVSVLGAVLAFMPLDFMAIALGKFFGFPHMTLVSVIDKEVLLLLLAFLLWRRNGYKPAAPDWFLL